MKHTVILLLTLLLLCALVLPLGAESAQQPIWDEANQLTSISARLKEKALQLQEQYGIFVAISYTNDLIVSSESVESYAVAEYNRLAAGASDGIIFYVSVLTRKWYIRGFGRGEAILNNKALDRLENHCVSLLKADRYTQAAEQFLNTAKEILEYTKDGSSYIPPLPWKRYLLYSLLVGLALAGITVFSMASQLKSVQNQRAAQCYLKKDSMKLTRQTDLYLYRTVTRVPRPRNNSSGGGRSGGGSGRGGSF